MDGQGWFIAGTTAISAASGLLIARSAPAWIADPVQAERVTGSRWYRPVVFIGVGILLAAAAAALHPADGLAVVDLVLLALVLGPSAAATGFLLVVDVLIHRLPDRLLIPLLGVVALGLVLGALVGDRGLWVPALVLGIAAAALFGLIHSAGRLLHARTLGLGDVKLAFLVGAVAGLHSASAIACVFIAMMLVAGAVSLLAAWRARRLRGTVIAFGPAMLSGMWLGSMLDRFLL